MRQGPKRDILCARDRSDGFCTSNETSVALCLPVSQGRYHASSLTPTTAHPSLPLLTLGLPDERLPGKMLAAEQGAAGHRQQPEGYFQPPALTPLFSEHLLYSLYFLPDPSRPDHWSGFFLIWHGPSPSRSTMNPCLSAPAPIRLRPATVPSNSLKACSSVLVLYPRPCQCAAIFCQVAFRPLLDRWSPPGGLRLSAVGHPLGPVCLPFSELRSRTFKSDTPDPGSVP
jgi:hypothetical protein